jgi:diaminopimelate epimerase
MRFWKGEALGNDYIVVDGTDGPPSVDRVRELCHRRRGVGSDGVLVADLSATPVGLRIFNPDGTEAEKSGNGLRIFGAWLHGQGRVGAEPFRVALPGETVELQVVDEEDGSLVLVVEMGRASFRAGDVPFADAEPDAQVADHPLELDGQTIEVNPVSLGNPHCVVLVDDLDDDEFRRLAPRIQRHPAFVRGVNMQFAQPVSPDVIEVRIWERGAGETPASGSSACAVACVAHRAELTRSAVEVRMPGGSVDIQIRDDWSVRLQGPARIVFSGEFG